MSAPNFPLKGFHGDGDSDIELSHSHPIYWTAKHTLISLITLAVFLLISYILVLKLT